MNYMPSQELISKIMAVCDGTKDAKEAAKLLNITKATLYSHCSLLRNHGYYPMLRHSRKTVNGNFLGELPKEITDWLHRTIPKDCTIAEHVRSIIIDAYYEENHKEEISQ